MDLNNKTVLTGIKPTGTLHMGNFVGAIRPMVDFGHQLKDSARHIMFIADYHAINAIKDPIFLKEKTRELASAYIACGIDATSTIFYKQSDISAVFELTTLLMAFTPKGFMNKAHAYKASVDKNIEKGAPKDANINMGLYTYPVLMAADILAYDTDLVPVGKDQVQHVEIASDIANAINAHYDENVLKIPQAYLTPNAQTLPGTDGRKMSKSYNNVIPLFAPEAELKKAIMGIQTDCQDLNAPKNPDDILLYQIALGILPDNLVGEIKEGLEKGGMGYGTIKKMILNHVLSEMGEKREKYMYYMAHFDIIEDMLAMGAKRANEIANPVLNRVKDAVLSRK